LATSGSKRVEGSSLSGRLLYWWELKKGRNRPKEGEKIKKVEKGDWL